MDKRFFAIAVEEMSSRRVAKHWNAGMVVASFGISLLGAFTSTQLMCQARTSSHFTGALMWTALGSLTFGFCSIWSLHQVAMLACELDLPIDLDMPLTVFSAIIAVVFTFAALGSDLLWDRYSRRSRSRHRSRKRRKSRPGPDDCKDSVVRQEDGEAAFLLSAPERNGSPFRDRSPFKPVFEDSTTQGEPLQGQLAPNGHAPSPLSPPATPSALRVDPLLAMSLSKHSHGNDSGSPTRHHPTMHNDEEVDATVDDESDGTSSMHGTSTDDATSRRSSAASESTASTFGLGKMFSVKKYTQNRHQAQNAFAATWHALRQGATCWNIMKGFLWSIAITSMHYVGISALKIPHGHFRLDPGLVTVSALISWVVCTVGCIVMAQMETHLTQQLLFSVVAATGVACMHFTGMRAATFWSTDPPSDERGYPMSIAIAVASIAIVTCIAANGLLAHAATISRNKLAEIVYTRRKLWMAVAQKENAEAAAAARSDFIASASHEIRTPLHQLQGYSDLLARTELSEEGRLLLYAIQHATKTLSLITSNVLDWSRLERNGETACRPIALDMRTVCESIINLLPQKDDDVEAELLVVVSPEVPHSLLLDETYLHRILMNLVSNALKFTAYGYVMLLVEIKDGSLVATVKDTGAGIPPAFLPQLFEPFKQAQTRGAHRGTGLGLSIVKQLLEKMDGTIHVDSRYQQSPGVGPENSGSVFTVTIPIDSQRERRKSLPLISVPRVAVFGAGNVRTQEGLITAWKTFGYEPFIASNYDDLSGEIQYIWTGASFLKENHAIRKQLLDQDRWTVIVPVDSDVALQEITGARPARHFVPVPKPFIWHSMMQQVAAAGEPGSRPSLTRTVRFSSKINVLDGLDQERVRQSESPEPEERFTVMLVEDNKINQKLGAKMLTSLGYEVITADDGHDAIEKLIEHDEVIDAILMDQSMPRKDGLTATKEIREMEQAGKLTRKARRPIIAVTAVVSSQAQMMCKLAGTDDFLAKPLGLGRLKQCLDGFLKS